jgi:hypothetical protein
MTMPKMSAGRTDARPHRRRCQAADFIAIDSRIMLATIPPSG